MPRVSELGAMSIIKCCKIAPIFEIQHDVLFRRISIWQLCMTERTQNREIPPTCSPIKLCNLFRIFTLCNIPKYLRIGIPKYSQIFSVLVCFWKGQKHKYSRIFSVFLCFWKKLNLFFFLLPGSKGIFSVLVCFWKEQKHKYLWIFSVFLCLWKRQNIFSSSSPRIQGVLHSQLCKAEMFSEYQETCRLFGRADLLESRTYHEAKRSAENYHSAKTYLKCILNQANYGSWIEKPNEEELFAN